MDFKALKFKADVDTDKGIFKGYAATWDLDKGNDRIIRGAFAKTLEEKSDQVKILWQHNSHEPIGRPLLMREDEKGLYIEGKISETTKGKDSMILLKDQVINQMSIGYTARDYEEENGERHLKEIELFEFSLVTWPMNDAAVITGVKELRPKEIERVLREAGLSKSQAACVANNGLKGLREVNDEDQNDELIQQIKSAANSLTYNLNK